MKIGWSKKRLLEHYEEVVERAYNLLFKPPGVVVKYVGEDFYRDPANQEIKIDPALYGEDDKALIIGRPITYEESKER